MRDVLKFTLCVVMLASSAVAQELPIKYAGRHLLLVGAPNGEEGVVPIITTSQQLKFAPISTIGQELTAGASVVRFGDILQLLSDIAAENQRLKAENERLWKLAENRAPASPPTPLIVQTAPQPDPNAAKRELQRMLIRSLFAPKPQPVQIYNYDCTRYPALCVH